MSLNFQKNSHDNTKVGLNLDISQANQKLLKIVQNQGTRNIQKLGCKTNRIIKHDSKNLKHQNIDHQNSAPEFSKIENKENVTNLSNRYLKRINCSDSSLKETKSAMSNMSCNEFKSPSLELVDALDTYELIRDHSKDSIGRTEKRIINQYPYQVYDPWVGTRTDESQTQDHKDS